MVTILGPTASGKTKFAAQLASVLEGEVISADSRQVYRGMSIGTGKDLSEYIVNGKQIPYHLIDIVDAGYEYNIFEYQRDFINVYSDIVSRGKLPILCGGSGLYLETVLKNYHLKKMETDPEKVEILSKKTDDDLKNMLLQLKKQHNTSDILDHDRMIRAILIELSHSGNEEDKGFLNQINSLIIGIQWERNLLRERITRRLITRLEEGMIEEVESLIKSGLTYEMVKFYGLEYKYIALYLEKELDYSEMFRLLNIAIHQFAKRQMTWFRKMERSGFLIHWLNGENDTEENIREVLKAGILTNQ
ncbi:MAG: tRNA (adenosine(37)-N6)-dimethylallyltransferase MiaA [Bacteroidales bacterium]